MRKSAATLILLVSAGLLTWSAPAQEMAGGIVFARQRSFRIPFDPGEGSTRLRQLQLYVSTDQGRTWQPSATAPPDQRHFRFLADRDAYYWFAVQTQDVQGRLFPATMDGAQPSLKVVIDTTPPAVTLQPLAPRGNEVGVAWEIRDDNLDLSLPEAVRLEYRTPANPAWIPLSVPAGAAQFFWNPRSPGAVEVKLQVRDRAGNANLAGTTVQQGGAPLFESRPQQNLDNPFEQRPAAPVQLPPGTQRKLVNSKRISLGYELKEVGPSGISTVELWYTIDGRSWNKYPVRFGEDPAQKNIVFDVAGEGVYGITLVAKSGVGLGDKAPQIGDPPQIWIEVDLTRPETKLHGVLVGQGADKGKLAVTWSARDRNLAGQPITLSYAEQADGPWTTIAEKLPNTGRYVWPMPEQVPYQFHVRVEAADLAGNVGQDVTESLVKVDLSQPKVKILEVAPAGQ